MENNRIKLAVPGKIKDMINRCNTVNQITCEHCKRNKTCKEYLATLKIKKLEEELNNAKDN